MSEQIKVALASKPHALVIDLNDVEFFASAGLGILIATHRSAGQVTKVAVAAPGYATTRPTTVTGIDESVPLFASVSEAVTALQE